MKNRAFLIFSIIGTGLLASCSTYMTPGKSANMATFTDPSVKKAYKATPAIHFPANLAFVRVQASGYRSASTQGVGSGAYSVVTTRDIEKESDFNKISALPGIQGVTGLNRLLLPNNLSSDLEIREAAAKLQTDAILIYTFDTVVESSQAFPPLTLLSLGLLTNTKFKINSSASAILMDTKTGYIYGAIEENSTRSGVSVPVVTPGLLDAARKQSEREAFDKLLVSFEPFWTRVYKRFNK